MKKLISVLLCAVMLMMIPVQALAAQGDVIIDSSSDSIKNGFQSWCSVGDALYIMPYDSSDEPEQTFYVHRAGESEPTEYTVQLGEPLGEDSYEDVNIMSNGEKVYALRTVTFYGEGAYSVRAELYEITVDGDQATGTLIGEPDYSMFATDDGYYNSPQDIIGVGDYLMGRYYDDMGSTRMIRMSLSDLKFVECAFEGDLVSVTPYLDGKALIQNYADGEGRKIQFLTYDPVSDTFETLIELDVEQYESFYGLACDSETGAVYFTDAGEVYELNLQTGEIGEALTDMPVSANYGQNAVMLAGGYYAMASYEAYAIRNIHPEQKASRTLKVYDNSYESYVTKAFYGYANAHGDVSMVVSRDYSDVENLVEDMMNRSDDVDVYIIRSESSDYEAVFNRGYMAELTGSEKLKAAAERMYPEVREALSINGELCAWPVNFTFNLPLLQKDSLEKIGLTPEDIPTNWSDFLDFLIEDLPGMLPEDGSVILTDPWTSDVWAKESFFNMIFDSYQQLIKKDPNAISTDQIVEILQKLEKVDFAALGQPSQEETDDEEYNYNNNYYLMELNTYCTLQTVTNYPPLVLSLTADTPRLFSLTATVAFINPFSKNKDLALELMEELADSLPYGVTYGLYMDMDEPIENDTYEESLANLQKALEEQKAEYEKADAIDKPTLKEYIENLERTLDGYSKYKYDLSPEAIEWIHANMPLFAIQGENWLYSDDSGEAYELVIQYTEGQIDARKLMDGIGKKIQMMLMEGY